MTTGRRIRFGVVLPQHDAGGAELLGAARLAEQSALDSVWLSDHLWGRGEVRKPFLECWTSLAFVAAGTAKPTVGTLVLAADLRLPRLVAEMVRSLDLIAPGRVIIGLGIADASAVEERRAFGIPLPPRRRRIESMEATISEVRKSAPGVRLLAGGGSEDVLRLAIDAGAWNFWGPADQFEEKLGRLRRLAANAPLPEVSWAGSFPGAQMLDRIVGAGAQEVIIAVGARNYAERIEQLAAYRDGLGG